MISYLAPSKPENSMKEAMQHFIEGPIHDVRSDYDEDKLALDQNTHNILIMAVAPVPIHQNSVDGVSLTMPKPTMNWLEPWSVVAKQLMTTTMTP